MQSLKYLCLVAAISVAEQDMGADPTGEVRCHFAKMSSPTRRHPHTFCHFLIAQ